ncbi:MAG: hypothetical protein ACKV2Q_11395 [Planctomycetaceae bacterium]
MRNATASVAEVVRLRTDWSRTLLAIRPLVTLCWMCLLGDAVGSEAYGENQPSVQKAKRPVIAVLPVTGDGPQTFLPLLEDRLSRNDGYALVDREFLDRILKEQEFAALSEAVSATKRVELGRLIGADVLVLMTQHSTPQPHRRVVISETLKGLRLHVTKRPISAQPENDATDIEKEIARALEKNSQPRKLICAVPPLVSRDLAGTHEHLQNAYARMLETMLSHIPGVFVVEIAEARAIAKELSLTRTGIERNLPLFLEGEFRFEATNEKVSRFVKLTARQGERSLGIREGKAASPEAGAEFFRTATRELITTAMGGKLAEQDLAADYRSLAQSARTHFLIGNYEEAAQVAEASLLLESRQPELHHLAMSAYGRCCWQEKKPVLEALPYYDQALAHLEQFLRQSEKYDTAISNSISEAFHETVYLTNDGDEETKKAVYAYRRRARDMYLRVIKAKHTAGTLNSYLVGMVLSRWLFEHDQYGEPLRENLQKRLDVVHLLLSKTLAPHIGSLVSYGLPDRTKKTSDYAWFLDELNRFEQPEAKSVVVAERAYIQKLLAPPTPTSLPAVKPNPNQKSRADFDLVPIVFQRTDGTAADQGFQFWGLLRCGDKTDLVWGIGGSKSVYLMETKGQLRKIAEVDRPQMFGHATFDGEYAWLPITGPNSQVFVVNPATGWSTRFTSEDGLPAFDFEASAEAGRGRLCLSGAFGRQTDRRAFIAVLELSDKRDKKFKIIHEATQQLLPDQPPGEQQRNLAMSFVPKFMVSRQSERDHSWQVVIARSMPGLQGRDSSLLVDLLANKIELIEAGVESHIIHNNVAFLDHTAYWATRNGLRTLHVDSKDSRPLRELPEEGRVLLHDGRLHVVAKQWWIADDMQKPFRRLNGQVPGSHFMHEFLISAHYGVVLRTSDSGWKVFQVVFQDMARKKPDEANKSSE